MHPGLKMLIVHLDVNDYKNTMQFEIVQLYISEEKCLINMIGRPDNKNKNQYNVLLMMKYMKHTLNQIT